MSQPVAESVYKGINWVLFTVCFKDCFSKRAFLSHVMHIHMCCQRVCIAKMASIMQWSCRQNWEAGPVTQNALFSTLIKAGPLALPACLASHCIAPTASPLSLTALSGCTSHEFFTPRSFTESAHRATCCLTCEARSGGVIWFRFQSGLPWFNLGRPWLIHWTPGHSPLTLPLWVIHLLFHSEVLKWKIHKESHSSGNCVWSVSCECAYLLWYGRGCLHTQFWSCRPQSVNQGMESATLL